MSDCPSISLDSDDYEDTIPATQSSSSCVTQEAINGTSLFDTEDLMSEASEVENVS